jgi:hypothetical protein
MVALVCMVVVVVVRLSSRRKGFKGDRGIARYEREDEGGVHGRDGGFEYKSDMSYGLLCDSWQSRMF